MKNYLRKTLVKVKDYMYVVRNSCIVAFLLLFSANLSMSQNVGVLSVVSPVSSCEPSSSQFVTIVIFNFGSSYSGSFDVSYEINNGSPVTETVTLASFPATSTYSYTFVSPVDLSTANTYNFKFYTYLVGDINTANDTINIAIASDTLSYGGSVDFSQVLCMGNNSGTLNLASALGSVKFWEFSINNGFAWNNIVNTTTVLNFNNIFQETWYRAVVKNGLCTQDTSSVAILTIDSGTIGGNILGGTTVCSPPNVGVLSLVGERGTILDWEYSDNVGGSWNSLGYSLNTYNVVNQPSTYLYRAIVQNGVCSFKYSDTAEVIVLNTAAGGITTPSNQSVCSGSNSGTITLSGNTGSIVSWQRSINSGSTWLTIANTSSIQLFTNLTLETWYRAVISDCNFDTSSIAKVFVDSPSEGGVLSPNSSVCINSNSGVISLSGENGIIVDWESSSNNGVSWSSLSNLLPTYSFVNLGVTTWFRVVVENGSCLNSYSDTAVITVDQLSDAGVITAPTNVCVNLNGGLLANSGTVGNIYDWEFSTNGGLTWTSEGNTTNTNIFTNLSQTTLYHVIVVNGSCPRDTTQFSIFVDSVSDAGTLFSSDTVCYLSSGTNYLSGYSGNIVQWELSDNNGLLWNVVPTTMDTLPYINIANRKFYRVIVKNGVCPNDTSNVIIMDVFPFNVYTNNDTTITLGNTATISASGGLFYSWTPTTGLSNPNSPSTQASPVVTTNYSVYIIDTFGCVFNKNVTVNVVDTVSNIGIIVSDLITANGDGYNDTWWISGIENFSDTKVVVFNRFGVTVFESSDYQNDWDGKFKGNYLPDNTYYYVVEIKDEPNVRKGFVTIISK